MKRHPTLLNFSGVSDGKVNLFVGQISFLLKADLTFLKYSRRKTFWTLLGLFRSKAAKTIDIELRFDHGSVYGGRRRHGVVASTNHIDGWQISFSA
jgi:hypothetical protein